MSLGKTSSAKQSNRLRKTLSAFLATVILLLSTSFSAMAADLTSSGASIVPDGGPIPPEPVDILCVSGTVINHQEQPLSNWTVRAIYEGTLGSYPDQTTTTNANGEFRFDLPGTGRWAFEVDIPDGWEAVTQARFAVFVSYGHTTCVPVRFKVRQLIEVIVYKIDDHHRPLVGWTIVATPGPGNRFATQQSAVTDENGVATFYLTPGEWTFTEVAPANVDWWTPISPPSGAQTINVSGPGPIEIRFKNLVVEERKGCIDIFKGDVPLHEDERSFGLQGWPIKVLRADGSIAARGETDAFGEITFSGLPYGPYTVQEIVLPGWEPVTPTTYNVFLTSQDQGCQRLEFYNQQIERGFCIVGQKIDAHEGVGLPNWRIIATPLHPGGVTPDPVMTDGEGRFRIDLPLEDYRIPTASYEVCEEPQDGWTTVGPSCYTVSLPRYVDLCAELPPFVNRQVENPAYGETPRMMVQTAPKGKGDAPACRATHIARPNDSVSRVAAYYGVSSQAILTANPWIRNQRHNWLYVGQQICIP
jgi:hypothetical protein